MAKALYRGGPPVEGEDVQYLGVYVLRWQREWGEPSMAFVEADDGEDKQLTTAIEALRRLRSAMDVEMGDSDLPDDDSEAMLAMQQAAAVLKAAGREVSDG